jgi:hypothetical protein
MFRNLSLSSLIVLLETYLNLKFYDYCSDGARSAAFFRNSRWRRRPCWFSQKLQFSEFAFFLKHILTSNLMKITQTFRCSSMQFNVLPPGRAQLYVVPRTVPRFSLTTCRYDDRAFNVNEWNSFVMEFRHIDVSQTPFRCSLTSCLQDECSFTSCPGRFPDQFNVIPLGRAQFYVVPRTVAGSVQLSDPWPRLAGSPESGCVRFDLPSPITCSSEVDSTGLSLGSHIVTGCKSVISCSADR